MTIHQGSSTQTLQGELSRLVGYKLLTWAIFSLWVTAIFVLFRLFRDFPPGVDSWLLWISPLMIIRGLAGYLLHREINGGRYVYPAIKRMERMAMLFGISDGLLVLTALIMIGGSGPASTPTLILGTVALLGALSAIYILTPRVLLVCYGLAVVPAIGVAAFYGINLPLELLLLGGGILGATFFAMLRFKKGFVRQLRNRLLVEDQVDRVNESNYVFNQHWQQTSVVCIDWDRKFRICSWNPAAERLFGYSAGEALGASLDLIFENSEGEKISSGWLHGSPGQPPAAVLRTARTKSGELLKTEWYDTVLTLDGDFIGVACFVIDIDERFSLWQRDAEPRKISVSI